MNARELLIYGENVLTQAGVPEAKLNAWYLFSYVTGMTKCDFYTKETEDIAEEYQNKYEKLIQERMTRKPLEYITHETEFMGLSFYVDEHVLVPRQDTECLVEEILPLVKGKDILDLCTGSGCIGVSLGCLAPCRTVTLGDLSGEALMVAKRNAEQNHVPVTCIQGDLFEHIEGKFDLIVSNPPYIPSIDVEELMPEVRDYEPRMALDGLEDGLHFYRRIVQESVMYLHPGGWLCFEIGYNQGKEVASFMEEAGFSQIVIKKDLAGLDRIVQGRRMEE